MKSIRMLGLTVAAVLALTAVASATSAVAATTVLCKENTTTCKLPSMYVGGTTVEAKLKSGTTSSLTTNGGLITHQTCTGSTLTGHTIQKEGVPIEFTNLTFSGCSGSCEKATGVNLPYSGGFSQTTGGNGTLSIGEGGGHGMSVKLTGCPISITCTFTGPIGFAFEGGNPALIVAKEESLPRESGGAATICGEFAKFSATYEVTSPKPIFAVGKEEEKALKSVMLCKEAQERCSEGKNYKSGTLLSAEAAQLSMTTGSPFTDLGSCRVTLAGKLLASSGEPSLPIELSSFVVHSCSSGGCSSVVVEGIPETASLKGTGSGDGSLTMPLKIRFSGCYMANTCTFEAKEIKFSFIGDLHPVLVAKEDVLPYAAGAGTTFCGSSLKLNGTFSEMSPWPAFVTEAT